MNAGGRRGGVSCGPGKCRQVGGPLEETPAPRHDLASPGKCRNEVAAERGPGGVGESRECEARGRAKTKQNNRAAAVAAWRGMRKSEGRKREGEKKEKQAAGKQMVAV